MAWPLVLLTLSGCTNLPVGGPSHHAIEDHAVSTLSLSPRHVRQRYVLVDITSDIIDQIPEIGPGSFFSSFGNRNRGSSVMNLGPGDSVQVTIFESSAGGLFAPGESSLRPGNFVTLPLQTVSQSGTIAVPYAGSVRVAGQTSEQAAKLIQSKLSNRAIEPQVILTVGEQVASSVTLVGQTSSKVPLRGNERVLDLIARGGGARVPDHELFVTLVRNGHSSTVYFPTLVRYPRENIFVAPGDILYLYREQQKFLAFGAFGVSGQTQGVTGYFTFDDQTITLVEALAKAGGLADTRANAEVFVYRTEPREALERMGVDVHNFWDESVPTIYRLNARDPSVFFLARRFKMRHKDALYIANSDSVELEKFLFHTQAISSTISGVAGDIVSTRDSIRALSR
ncbi:polysaccharide biosynthesis/export family protein [Pseudorhodoplanes sp.]|uniref:polysaccharide biosynthesis/export family protein n=1 Tax=Pseudorhodoplanes sp. TaxID=1934341 RepID=UPI003D0D919F